MGIELNGENIEYLIFSFKINKIIPLYANVSLSFYVSC